MDPSDVVQLQPLLKTILDGGPAAIVAILLLDLVLIIIISHYIIKMVLRSARDQIEMRERMLKDKEGLLQESTRKLEDIIERYHNNQSRIADALTNTQSVLIEIKGRLVAITDNGDSYERS